MFFHNFKYELFVSLRVKEIIIWLILFPIVLGTFFKIAFTGIYEKSTKFSVIPTAIVETETDPIFRQVIDSVTDSDDPLLKVTYTNEEKALEMLKKGDVKGIIYSGEKKTLTVSEDGIDQTVLKSFIEQYTTEEKIITDSIMNDPASAADVIAALSDEVSSCTEIPLTTGNTDNMIQYFYNLIAMVAMYGSITGLHITIQNQANLSALGARKSCSPTPKSISLLASLAGSFIVQTICMIICVSFLAFVLKVDFGSRLPLVYLSAIIGGLVGITMGFFIGSVGRFSNDGKVGILMAFSMLCCFLSGLMVGDMKAIIAKNIPWLNNINPAAVISDSFYCLNIYSDYSRFITKIITMLIISAFFTILGLILSRRKKYASL